MKKEVFVNMICFALSMAPVLLQAQAPVETQKANSNYKPAFAGQTRVNSTTTKTPYKVEKIA